MINIDKLKQKVISVFAETGVPEMPLVGHNCDECLRLEEKFAGRSWKDITMDLIREHNGDLPLFSSMAFHAFVPAYLIHSIDHLGEEDAVSEMTAYAFLPDKSIKKDQGLRNYQKTRLRPFSDEQFAVVLEFLQLVEETNEYFDCALMKRGKERLLELRAESQEEQ